MKKVIVLLFVVLVILLSSSCYVGDIASDNAMENDDINYLVKITSTDQFFFVADYEVEEGVLMADKYWKSDRCGNLKLVEDKIVVSEFAVTSLDK